MKKFLHKLRAGERGAAAIEFALAVPVLVLMVVGIVQLGVLFLANSGLRQAVAEGARYATIHPRPSTAQIAARVNASRFGLDPANMTAPVITYGASAGTDYAEIRMTYSVPMDFVFFSLPPVTLTETRRAFVYPAAT